MRLALSQAAEVRLGRQRAPQHEVGDHLLPYLRSANVVDGVLDLNDVKTMNFTPIEQAIFGLRDGDVLVTEGSGSRETVGVSAVWHADLPGVVCFQNTLLRLRPRAGVTDGRYLAWWARHAWASGQIAAVCSGANIQHIGSDGLKRLTIDVPTVEEQRRIADFLDDRVARIDQIITARNSQSALLIPRRRAAVAQAVAGLPKLPIRRLLRRVITGGTPGPEADSPGGLSWFSPGAFRADLTLGQPTRSVEPSACVEFPANTVVMVGIGATAGKVAWLDKRASGNQQLTCLEHHPQVAEARFLLHQLDALGDSLLRSAPAATLPIINNESLRAFNVAIAELQEQHRLSEEWDSRLAQDSEISGRLERSVHLLNEYKQALITAAVTGELDVTTAGSGIPG